MSYAIVEYKPAPLVAPSVEGELARRLGRAGAGLAGTLMVLAMAACGAGPAAPSIPVWVEEHAWAGRGPFLTPTFRVSSADWRVTFATRACEACPSDIHIARVHPGGTRSWTKMGGRFGAGESTLSFQDGALPHLIEVAAGPEVEWALKVEARHE